MSTSAGSAMDHASGMASRTIRGLKLKKVAMTTSAGTGPIAAARLAK